MLQDTEFDPSGTFSHWRAACDAASRMDEQTARWHADIDTSNGDFLSELHRANFDLWHLEDLARDPLASDATIADVKRSIDGVNQRRNDLAERVDQELLTELSARSLPRQDAPLHSETPGQMFDRMSILSLKIFHTAEELHRADVSDAHRHRNQERLIVLQTQRDDLCHCLVELCGEVLRGERRFKQYRQFKMYNDPDSNPVLYRAAAAAGLRKD